MIGRKGTINKPVFYDKPFWTVDTLFYTKIKEKYYPKFVYYLFNTINWLKYNEATGVPSLTSNNIKKIKIKCPSYNEQKEISEFFTVLDQKIDLMEKKYNILKKYSKCVRHLIFENISKKSLFYAFEDIFKSISTKQYQIKKSEIRSEGNIPVVDQGKQLIAGYSNKTNNILKNKGIILFGDHTTILKFIDFDFIVGADGVKLLISQTKKNNTKFLFYALKEYNITAEGYKRHYSILKQIDLPVPNITIQNHVEQVLTNLDYIICLLKREIELNKEFKRTLLNKMFC